MSTMQERYQQWLADQGSQAIIREHRGDDTEMWEAAYTQGWKDAIEAAATIVAAPIDFDCLCSKCCLRREIAAEIRSLAE